jgi:hypothetical protein
MGHPLTLWPAHNQCYSTIHNSYYHEILRRISKQGNAKPLVYSEYLFGALIVQVLDAFAEVEMASYSHLHHFAIAMHYALALALTLPLAER